MQTRSSYNAREQISVDVENQIGRITISWMENEILIRGIDLICGNLRSNSSSRLNDRFTRCIECARQVFLEIAINSCTLSELILNALIAPPPSSSSSSSSRPQSVVSASVISLKSNGNGTLNASESEYIHISSVFAFCHFSLSRNLINCILINAYIRYTACMSVSVGWPIRRCATTTQAFSSDRHHQQQQHKSHSLKFNKCLFVFLFLVSIPLRFCSGTYYRCCSRASPTKRTSCRSSPRTQFVSTSTRRRKHIFVRKTKHKN